MTLKSPLHYFRLQCLVVVLIVLIVDVDGAKQPKTAETVETIRARTQALSQSKRRTQQQQQQQQQQQRQSSGLFCDVSTDFCPTRFDGVCDRTTDTSCQGGDCFDCDECRIYESDCEGCVANGCVWCPGDATCFNSDQYVLLNREVSCIDPSDFTTTCTSQSNVFNDPLYSAQQWVYEMINVEEVWSRGYQGQGIRVRINDNGVDIYHPEFEGRVDMDASCPLYLPSSVEGAPDASHGTYVAGILGATADNGICSSGVAPQVTLSSCNVFGDDPTIFLDADQMALYDIAQNSFGETACNPRLERRAQRKLQTCPFSYDASRQGSTVPFPCDLCGDDLSNMSQNCEQSIVLHCKAFYDQDKAACLEFLDLLIVDDGCYYSSLPIAVRNGLTRGVLEGRDGKGIIFVAASGNSYRTGGDTNLGGYLSSRFVISVGGVGKSGLHASYSVPGASLFVTGPGGDVESISSHVTATYSSTGALCQNAGIGTSFACPVVSAVVALMLEANPELTWRDVQEILAVTSQQVDDADDDTVTTNVAGYWHSNYYGFGIVDASAAVTAAESWQNIGDEQMLTEESGLVNLPIVDNPTNVTTSRITISSSTDSFRVQSVQVMLDLEHYSRGHLEITLTSPQGTRSILHPGRRPENTQLDSETDQRWKFMTVKSWGESPNGNWTLDITDLKEGEVSTTCVDTDWIIDRSNAGNGELDPIDCRFVENIGACINGQINPLNLISEQDLDILLNQYTDDEGLKATEACCACGGQGVSRQEVTDQLRQWTLVIYGQLDQNTGNSVAQTPRPTPSPTISPSLQTRPSSIPSISPTLEPSPKPEESVITNDPQTSDGEDEPEASDGADEQPAIPDIAIPSDGTQSPGFDLENDDNDNDDDNDDNQDIFSGTNGGRLSWFLSSPIWLIVMLLSV